MTQGGSVDSESPTTKAGVAPTSKFRYTKPEKGWMLYDFTTNAYATIVLTAIFPIYFNAFFADPNRGLEWKGYAQSFIMLVAALSSPILGALGDRRGMKKRLWGAFAMIGIIGTISLAFAGNWPWLLAGYVVSNIAYNCANLFYDSFLTDVASKDRMHRVSTTAYAIGYYGGGTVMLIVTVALMFTLNNNSLAAKLSFGLTGLWWIVFSLPMLLRVRQTHHVDEPTGAHTRLLWSQLRTTVVAIAHHKRIWLFMLAYFFYIDGVGTVISMATSYGSTLHLNSSLMIVAILTTQIVAGPFSILFGRLAERFTAIRMILIAIIAYIVICLIGFYMGYSIDAAASGSAAYDAAVGRDQVLFWVMAGMVGMVQGGIQALSRSQFGQMIPADRSNEYFGFFNIFSRFAAILGPLLMALMTTLTGHASYGILSIIVLFIIGAALLIGARRHLDDADPAEADLAASIRR